MVVAAELPLPLPPEESPGDPAVGSSVASPSGCCGAGDSIGAIDDTVDGKCAGSLDGTPDGMVGGAGASDGAGDGADDGAGDAAVGLVACGTEDDTDVETVKGVSDVDGALEESADVDGALEEASDVDGALDGDWVGTPATTVSQVVPLNPGGQSHRQLSGSVFGVPPFWQSGVAGSTTMGQTWQCPP